MADHSPTYSRAMPDGTIVFDAQGLTKPDGDLAQLACPLNLLSIRACSFHNGSGCGNR